MARDGKPSALFVCPSCRFTAALAETHEIAADGTVSPSVVCPGAGCDFHAFVRLAGWSP